MPNKLAGYRTMYGINQSTIAKVLGIALPTYCNKEKNNKAEFTRSEMVEITKLLKVADLSSDILDEIYRRIVEIQLSNNLEVRLYSAFDLIRLEEEVKELRKKAGENRYGSKFNR